MLYQKHKTMGDGSWAKEPKTWKKKPWGIKNALKNSNCVDDHGKCNLKCLSVWYRNFTLLGKGWDINTEESPLYARHLLLSLLLGNSLSFQLPHCSIANILGDSGSHVQQSPYTVFHLPSSHKPCPFDHLHPNLDCRNGRTAPKAGECKLVKSGKLERLGSPVKRCWRACLVAVDKHLGNM